jgi:hypothetical protein
LRIILGEYHSGVVSSARSRFIRRIAAVRHRRPVKRKSGTAIAAPDFDFASLLPGLERIQ